MKSFKKLLKVAGLVIAIPVLYITGVIIYGSLNDWNPEAVIQVPSAHKGVQKPDSIFSFISWNIGFGALGAETSFFYDGGETVIQTKELVDKNLMGVAELMSEREDVDIFMIQEIDSAAKRSHYINQVDLFQNVLDGYERSFTMNYNVDFVPLPLTHPFGEVRSGLATYSAFPTTECTRYAFDSQFEWPRRVFFLDRCFLKQRIALEDGKSLVIINTHCSAYDKSGEMVKNEIEAMLKEVRSEYANGNYVVIGGDWNHCPPDYKPVKPGSKYNEHMLTDQQIPDGWNWVADIKTPTNRKLDIVYDFDLSYKSCIDHYLVSPNVEVLEVQTIDCNFEYSDHHPVFLQIKLLP